MTYRRHYMLDGKPVFLDENPVELPSYNGSNPGPHIESIACEPIPYKDWPEKYQAIADMREDGDIGIGDTIERKLGEGGVAFKVTLKALGFDCGCSQRKNQYNQKYPYSMIKSN